MGEAQQILDGLREPVKSLRSLEEGAWQGFAAMSGAAMADGALPRRTKELIALAVSVTKQCDGCIASHAKAAARHGASREEVAEALSVALVLNGGPATVYGPRAFAAFEEFAGPSS